MGEAGEAPQQSAAQADGAPPSQPAAIGRDLLPRVGMTLRRRAPRAEKWVAIFLSLTARAAIVVGRAYHPCHRRSNHSEPIACAANCTSREWWASIYGGGRGYIAKRNASCRIIRIGHVINLYVVQRLHVIATAYSRRSLRSTLNATARYGVLISYRE